MKRWVLVVDDDRDIRDVITLLLGHAGYDATSAADGVEALDRIRARGRPALVLLDLRMPRLSGAEFVHALRADPSLATVPVVVLSGDASSADDAAAIAADGWLAKPIELADLLATVERVIADA